MSWATVPSLLVAADVDANDRQFNWEDHVDETAKQILFDVHDVSGRTVTEQASFIDRDMPYSEYDPDDTRVLYRLRKGVERFFTTDIGNPAASAQAQSAIHVMFDEIRTDLATNTRDLSHSPPGANVLFMDGRVEFVRFRDGRWPVTNATSVILGHYNPLFERLAEGAAGAGQNH